METFRIAECVILCTYKAGTAADVPPSQKAPKMCWIRTVVTSLCHVSWVFCKDSNAVSVLWQVERTRTLLVLQCCTGTCQCHMCTWACTVGQFWVTECWAFTDFSFTIAWRGDYFLSAFLNKLCHLLIVCSATFINIRTFPAVWQSAVHRFKEKSVFPDQFYWKFSN